MFRFLARPVGLDVGCIDFDIFSPHSGNLPETHSAYRKIRKQINDRLLSLANILDENAENEAPTAATGSRSDVIHPLPPCPDAGWLLRPRRDGQLVDAQPASGDSNEQRADRVAVVEKDRINWSPQLRSEGDSFR